MADEPEIEDGESEGGGKSKGLLFLALGVIVLIIGVAAFFLIGSGGDDFSGGEETQQAQLAASTAEAGPTEIYDLKEFKVNLSGSAGSRILQMNISVGKYSRRRDCHRGKGTTDSGCHYFAGQRLYGLRTRRLGRETSVER